MWPSTVSGAGRDQEWLRISVQGLGTEIEVLQHDVGAPRPVVVSLGKECVEGVLARVPARPMTAVVPEGYRLGQGHVDPDAAGDRCRDLGHLEGMRQPGALMVGRIDDDLGLAGQASECCGVHDSIAVTFEAGALVVGLLCDRSRPRSFGKGSAGSERRALALLAKLATHDGPGPSLAREPAWARTRSPSEWPAMVSAQALARGVTSSATGDAQLRSCQIKITAGGVGQPAVGQCNRGAWAALPSAGRSELRSGEWDARDPAGTASRRARRVMRPSTAGGAAHRRRESP